MKRILTTTLQLLMFVSYAQQDSILVEFDSFNGVKLKDYQTRYYNRQLPKVDLDTLRSKDEGKPFSGILITNYKWISNYHPGIFRTTVDSVVNGNSMNHKFIEIRSNNWVIADGYSNDSLYVRNEYMGVNGNISEKTITIQIDSFTVSKEVFSYHTDSAGRLMDHYFTINDEKEGMHTICFDDSLTMTLNFHEGRLIDIQNENTIFLDEKNKIISKEIFFKLTELNQNLYLSYFVIRGEFKEKRYRFIICYPEPGAYRSYDHKFEEKLINWGTKNIYLQK